MWTNYSWEILKKELGAEKFNKLLNEKKEATPSCVTSLLGQNALSMASHNALKKVPKKRGKLPMMLKRFHSVGAVGYAYVLPDNPIKHCEFFQEDRSYKIRFRVSNINCRDDREGCIREVAIKFADLDHDGPFDMFFQTGRMSLVRDSSTFLQMLNLKSDDDVEKWCLKNPYTYRALVDGLRKGPSSFADLSYHTQICYRISMTNKKKQLVRFRLVPNHWATKYNDVKFSENKEVMESGMLTREEQMTPWLVEAPDDDDREDNYLKQDFKARLWRNEPISFYMDVQMGPQSRDYDHVNPQLLWDANEFPWKRLMNIELTTHLASEAIQRTTFNMADNPVGIGFPTAQGPQDPFSLQKVMISTYTELERKEISQVCDPLKDKTEGAFRTSYIITIFSESLKENRPIPFVEIYITLLGMRCRSSPLVLNSENREGNWEKVKHYRKEVFRIVCDTVGDLLGAVVEVYYRHITESWFLRTLIIKDNKQNKTWTFPCYEVVENPILLLPGEAYLAHNQLYEVSKKERLFQLNERQLEYLWDNKKDNKDDKKMSSSSGIVLPGQIRNPQQVNKLPERHKSRAAKYTGIRWEVDPKLIDFFREFRFRLAVDKSVKSEALRGKMKKAKLLSKPKGIHMHESSEVKKSGKTKRQIFTRQLSHEIDGKSRYNKVRQTNFKSRVLGHENEDDVFTNNNTYKDSSVLKKIKDNFKRFKSVSVSKDPNFQIEILKTDRVDGYRKIHLTFDLESKLPDGSPGDMCHAVLDDIDFGSLFLVGSNPMLIKRCLKIPSKFPVKDFMVSRFLDDNDLQSALEAGRLYIVDYEILNKISTVELSTERRYIAAPMVLLYLNNAGKLLPLAIQINQTPSPSNPIWTPEDKEGWLLAKLWVRCSDFNHQFAISHLFNCHFLMEPFLIATMRCLPSSHPCYKILLPHFRYLLTSNTLIRHQILCENGAVDKYTSLGRQGFQELMERHWSQFHFDQLNPTKDFDSRGVADDLLLPGYTYRDDSMRLFTCIRKCCDKLLSIHYGTHDDFEKDEELTRWFDELSSFGFPGHFNSNEPNKHEKKSFFPPPLTSSFPLIPSAPPIGIINKQQFSFDETNSKFTNLKNHSSNDNAPPDYFKTIEKDSKQNLYASDTATDESVYDEISSSAITNYNINFNDNKNMNKIFTKTINPSNLNKEINKLEEKDEHPSSSYMNIHHTSNTSKINRPSNLKELGELLATIIFTITCQHSATHSDALDLFGYIPDVPGMMKEPPVSREFKNIDSTYLAHILPEQFPEAYYTSLLFIMNAHKPDQNLLGEMDEVYFVDDESIAVLEEMKKELRTLTIEHGTRNFRSNVKYDCLLPKYITSSPEPLPFVPKDKLDKILVNLGTTLTVNAFLEQISMGTTASSFAMEQSLFFYEAFGGRSTRGLFTGDNKQEATNMSKYEVNAQPKTRSKPVRQVLDSVTENNDFVDGLSKSQVKTDIVGAKEKRERFARVTHVMSTEY